MLISVIIPTRNRSEYVKQLIKDLHNQDITNFEIIVVDQTEEGASIQNCKHIKTRTLGPCVSKNIGVEASRGDIIVFIDDDARVENNFLREITLPIINNRFDAVAGAICDEHGNYLRHDKDFLNNRNDNFIKVLTANPDSEKSRISLAFPVGCGAILKSVFLKVGGFDESFDPTGAGEDRDMALKLYKNGYAIWYNSNAKLLHLVASEGGSRDVGSRSMMLDVHTYIMSKKYFSEELSSNIRDVILKKYKKNLQKSIFIFNEIRTKYKLLKKIKQLLNEHR